MDPLGTGRIRPYVDKKYFFQELKNPPKKVLKDLTANTSVITSSSSSSSLLTATTITAATATAAIAATANANATQPCIIPSVSATTSASSAIYAMAENQKSYNNFVQSSVTDEILNLQDFDIRPSNNTSQLLPSSMILTSSATINSLLTTVTTSAVSSASVTATITALLTTTNTGTNANDNVNVKYNHASLTTTPNTNTKTATPTTLATNQNTTANVNLSVNKIRNKITALNCTCPHPPQP